MWEWKDTILSMTKNREWSSLKSLPQVQFWVLKKLICVCIRGGTARAGSKRLDKVCLEWIVQILVHTIIRLILPSLQYFPLQYFQPVIQLLLWRISLPQDVDLDKNMPEGSLLPWKVIALMLLRSSILNCPELCVEDKQWSPFAWVQSSCKKNIPRDPAVTVCITVVLSKLLWYAGTMLHIFCVCFYILASYHCPSWNALIFKIQNHVVKPDMDFVTCK